MTTSKKGETPKAAPAPKTVESLLAEIAELKKALANQPASLEEKIKFYQEKQEKIKKLNVLDGFAQSLVEVGQQVQEEAETDEFSTEKFALRISKKANSYREDYEDVVKIKNPVLVAEMLGYCLERINTKRDVLRKVINA